jgi:chaperone required for assembly of F1-ATPase
MKAPTAKRTPLDRAALRALIDPYAESDVLCYRADNSPALAARQAEVWDPLLDWARARFDIAFHVTTGIVHVPQPPATIERLRDAISPYSAAQLVPLHTLTTIGGSLVTALMVAEAAIAADAAFDACHLDELWQMNLWGEDWLATEERAKRKADYVAAADAMRLTPSTHG